MTYIQTLESIIEKVQQQQQELQEKLEEVEKELADVKLNPYGITSIDFSERSELMEDATKIEGTLMGLQLAKETYEESEQ